MKQLLRELPPVHELQKSDKFQKLVDTFDLSEKYVTKIIQEVLSSIRSQLLNGNNPLKHDQSQSIVESIWLRVENELHSFQKERITRVINGTGTVLHTNLGRSRLSKDAIEHVKVVAESYSNLEYNISMGKRGSRHDIIEDLLKEVTGAEAAMVVNNNAAAVFLILRALAKEKEVIVSRGQLVEIGGSFRVSAIMEESGANLVEVGTTNKTHLYDYEQAITEETGMILKVHTSNFKTIGFTKSVSTDELVHLSNQHEQLVFYEDLGSGSLYDFQQSGIGDEPVVKQVIESGVDLVSFSGDKLLGGPQAGIIVGKESLIKVLKKHQLARVLRVDKMTLAGLETTLRAYINEQAAEKLPTVRDIIKPIEQIRELVEYFIAKLQTVTSVYTCEILEDTSQVGGGTMPGVEVSTFVVAIKHQQSSAQELANQLRKGSTPVITRVKENNVLIDFRTITKEETDDLVQAFTSIGV
ncbi:L-seryl-tRNA(Sec) selenium transferase [Aquibacillus albus]|uniref:L-seryl-tRNA(Sec) selenium transferase n=1 Tax=Aquibacillus albus TaxID=1168171 RepID=A0ABS2N572_9BACI|nr:L-seryl-tRNA(Sec) selenium transferase [Aquibacillus albus]MBM7573229.1 L-seryl-tRNA(Ser) seleniumtransferase [Aquibacillus albus]